MSSHCVLTKFDFEEHTNDLEQYSALFGNQIPIYRGKKITKRYLWKHFSNERTENMYSDGEDRYFFHNALSFFKKSTLINKPFDENVVGKEDRYWAVDIINSGINNINCPVSVLLSYYILIKRFIDKGRFLKKRKCIMKKVSILSVRVHIFSPLI